jgi:Transposase DDE domain
VLSQDKVRRLLSSEHFTVDGTLLEAWASPKSCRAKDGSGEPPAPGRNGGRDFHGERRRNDTHASTTDLDARLFRKGSDKEARLCFMGHALMENRNGLIVGAVTTRASGHAERLAALALIEPHAERPQPMTLGADKGYDTGDFVMELRDKAVTPHIAQNASARRSAIDGRTTRHPGYAVSQRIRKRVEEAFGWDKTVAGLRKMRHRGLPKVGWQFTLAMAAYDLVRLPKLLAQPAARSWPHADQHLRNHPPAYCRSPHNSLQPPLTTRNFAETRFKPKFVLHFQHPVRRRRNRLALRRQASNPRHVDNGKWLDRTLIASRQHCSLAVALWRLRRGAKSKGS